MAVAVVQRATVQGGSSAGNKTLAFGANVTAGNAIILVGWIGTNAPGALGFTDSLGNTITDLAYLPNASNFQYGRLSIIKQIASTGAMTITLLNSASQTYNITMYEVSGLDTTQPWAGLSTSGAGFGLITSGTLSYGQAGSTGIAIGLFNSNGNTGTWTLGSGYSNLQFPAIINGMEGATEEKLVTGAGSTNATATSSTNGTNLGFVTVFSSLAEPLPSGPALKPRRAMRQAVRRAAYV